MVFPGIELASTRIKAVVIDGSASRCWRGRGGALPYAASSPRKDGGNGLWYNTLKLSKSTNLKLSKSTKGKKHGR